jgi:hypothetical protein
MDIVSIVTFCVRSFDCHWRLRTIYMLGPLSVFLLMLGKMLGKMFIFTTYAVVAAPVGHVFPAGV